MKLYKIKVDTVVKYILMLLFLYFSQMGFLCNVRFPQYSTYIMTTIALMVMGIFVYAFVCRGAKIPYRAIVVVGVCILNYGLTMVINNDIRGAYFLLVLNLLSALCFIGIFDRYEFYEVYTNCIVGITLISMLTVYVLHPLVSSFISVNKNGIGKIYYNYGVTYPLVEEVGHRLNAIWTEPGVTTVYLMFALVFGIFILKANNVKNMVLLMGMLFTRSSTAYVVLALIVGTWVLKYVIRKRDMGVLLSAGIIVILSVFILFVCFPQQMLPIIQKYSYNNISFIGRFAPMLYNIERGLQSPIWGQGFHEGMFRVNYSFYRGTLYCNTSTTTSLFHFFGVLLPIMSIVASWKICRTNKNEYAIISLLLTFILVLGVNFESLVLEQVYTILLFSIFMPLKKGIETR